MQSNGAVMQFKKTDYNHTEILPDAEPGHYTAKVTEVMVGGTKKDPGVPMLTLSVKLATCEDEQDEKNLGKTLKAWIVFRSDSGGNMGKRSLEGLLKGAELDDDIVPKSIESKSDFDEFIDAVKGKVIDVWVSNDDQARTSCEFYAPAQKASSLPLGDADDDADDKPRGKKPAAKSGGKTARR